MAEAGGLRMGTAAGRWVLATTVLGSGIVMIDGTVVNVALASIGQDLDAGLQRSAVDGERLHAGAGVAHPARRVAGRPLRPQADLPDRRGVVRAGVARLRAGPERRGAHRRAGAAGRRRRAADPREPRPDLGVVPRPRPRRGGRRVVGARRDRGRGRPVPRRMAGRVDVAGRLPDQPPARGAGHRRRDAACAGEPRPGVGARPRRLGSGARRARAGAAHLGPHHARRRPGATALGLAHDGGGRRGARRVRRWSSGVRRTRSCRPRCSPTRCSARPTPPRCSSTARWASCSSCWCCNCRRWPGFSPLAAGTDAAAAHRDHVPVLGAGRCARRAHRAAATDDRRAAGVGLRTAAPAAHRARRVVAHRRAARAWSCSGWA